MNEFNVLLAAATNGTPSGSLFDALFARYITPQESWRELESPLPITILSAGKDLIDYRIYGNTVQNGTPTPENPIMPSGCGERTENLFDVNANNPDNGYAYGKQVTLDGSVDTFPQANVSEYISITPFSSYTFTYGSQYNDVYAALYNAKREFVRSIRYNGQKEITFYSQEDENYLRVTYLRSKGNTVMLNLGSTALPYEPYGYKLPILSNSTVTDIYLEEVETTRRIKKLVLTGEEDWKTSSESKPYISVSNYIRSIWGTTATLSVCSHFSPSLRADTVGRYNLGGLTQVLSSRWNGNVVFNPGMSTTDFKSYLAAQYAAGTPVTVWYILAEPETGIVNEPLMRIGDYADTISMEQAGVSIPTAVGTTIIDYNPSTTPAVEPEKMYVKFKP